jgi:hypothetical protein
MPSTPSASSHRAGQRRSSGVGREEGAADSKTTESSHSPSLVNFHPIHIAPCSLFNMVS